MTDKESSAIKIVGLHLRVQTLRSLCNVLRAVPVPLCCLGHQTVSAIIERLLVTDIPDVTTCRDEISDLCVLETR